MDIIAYEDDPRRVAAKVPYNLIERCRLAPGGRWDATNKCWHWPLTALPRLLQSFPRLRVPPREELKTSLKGANAVAWHKA